MHRQQLNRGPRLNGNHKHQMNPPPPQPALRNPFPLIGIHGGPEMAGQRCLPAGVPLHLRRSTALEGRHGLLTAPVSPHPKAGLSG
eukprot:7772137-Heterocapsa_arctica.AAC.1